MELTIEQALQQGVAAHKEGKLQDADRLYTAILKSQPKNPDANHNMGVLAVGVGKVFEALPFFKTALESNSSTSQFWLSYIDALIKLDRIADAKTVFDQAKEKGAKGDVFDQIEKTLARSGNKSMGRSAETKAQDPLQEQINYLINLYNQGKMQQALGEASRLIEKFTNSYLLYNIQGAANKGLGQLDAAIYSYKQAISFKPDNAEAFYNMGIALKEQGKVEEAVEAYNKAILLKPDYAVAYNNMGNALKEQGKVEEAVEAYNKAVFLKPNNADAFYNMGVALKEQGKLQEAIEAYNKAIFLKPDNAEAFYNMGVALKDAKFTAPSSAYQLIISSILDHKTYVMPSDISQAAISLLKFEPAIKNVLRQNSEGKLKQSIQETVLALSELPLLLKLMSVCPLADLELEAVLTDIRTGLLLSALEVSGNSNVLRFQSAVALQCFTNEYVYEKTDIETKALEVLEGEVSKGLSNGQQPSPQSILCLASYKALHEYEWCNHLAVTPEIEEVFTRQVREPELENRLKSHIPALQGITDKVSSKVREQYEESPYPRWVNLGLSFKPDSISMIIDKAKLRLFDEAINEVEAPNILIAGCGTGKHSIESAANFKNSKILAIDLSSSSLAYAKRKTEELGVPNIDYMQADILDLGKLDRQFDMIESAGVLHHMDDPMAGWRVLTDCLKSGGLMRIGLYSELARQHIVKIRQEISKSAIGSSDLAMKSLRSSVINSDENHHKEIAQFPDFYSLSTLRDLLFHVQEHRFSIPQIQDCLFELGLRFCGFDSINIVRNFKSTNTGEDDPYDLDKWNAYEEANPHSFIGMYQFWCQKVA